MREKNDTLKWRFAPTWIETLTLIVGGVLVGWYSWIVDDAYVYFRYVDNWIIHGNGIVWNPGEYVEGFSSPLWMLLLAGLRLLHLDYWLIVRAVGLLSYVAFWWLACLVHRGLNPGLEERSQLNMPLVYLSATYAVLCYFTSGLEAPLVHVAAAAYAAAIVLPRHLVLQAAIGLTPLIRHELVLPFLIFVGWSALIKKERCIAAVAVFLASIGSYGVFRIWYYADLLPNTFYLKDITWFLQGIVYVSETAITYFTVPFGAFMLLLYWALKRSGREPPRRRERLAMLAIALPVILYVIKIGGDPRHFRYLAFPYILAVMSSGGIVEQVIASTTLIGRRTAGALVLVFGSAVACCYPRQLQMHPAFRSKLGFSHTVFRGIADAAFHRFHERGITPAWNELDSQLSYSRARERHETDARARTVDSCRLPGCQAWSTSRTWLVAQCDASGGPMIAESWCQPGYLLPGFPAIHRLGLTEPFLARTEMESLRAAHKVGLRPLAKDLLELRCHYGFGRGVFEKAVDDGVAPEWIEKNLGVLTRIEKKAYNQHDLFENAVLAFTPAGRVVP